VQRQLERKEVGPHRDGGGASHNLRTHLLATLWHVYYENSGPSVLFDHRAVSRTIQTSTVPVLDIRFSHDCISENFSNGDHAGAKIDSLIGDLNEGRVDPLVDPRLTLRVVRFNRELVSLNNRRLYALHAHQQHKHQQKQQHLVYARVLIFPLDPVTAKFALSYTTQCCGNSVMTEARSGS